MKDDIFPITEEPQENPLDRTPFDNYECVLKKCCKKYKKKGRYCKKCPNR